MQHCYPSIVDQQVDWSKGLHSLFCCIKICKIHTNSSNCIHLVRKGEAANSSTVQMLVTVATHVVPSASSTHPLSPSGMVRLLRLLYRRISCKLCCDWAFCIAWHSQFQFSSCSLREIHVRQCCLCNLSSAPLSRGPNG